MRVCLICIEMFGSGMYGGFGRATRFIGRELVRRNIETIAVVPRRRYGRQEDYTIEGMRVAHFDPKSIKATIDLYRTCDADIYHSQDTLLSTYLAMRAMPDRAHMVTFRDPMDLRDLAIEFKYAKPHRLGLLKAMFYVENPLVRRAIHRADDLNCPAKFLIPKVRKKFNLKSDVYFLPTPVDVPETVRKAEKPTVCFIARWDPRKRPELFFELARQFPDVHFVAVGGSTDKERDTYLRRTYSGIPNLEMTGIIDQFETDRLQNILEKSWVLVNTSAREGLPETFCEAGAYKGAILSFSDPDQFASKFGYHARDGNLVKGLSYLLEDDRWKSRGELCYQYVKSVYATDPAMVAHLDAYERALGRQVERRNSDTSLLR